MGKGAGLDRQSSAISSMIQWLKIIVTVFSLTGLSQAIDAANSCAERQALTRAATNAGYVPNAYFRLEGNWRDKTDLVLPDYARRGGEVGIEYSFRELFRSKFARELTDIECTLNGNELGAEQVAEVMREKSQLARLNAEIGLLSINLPKVQAFAKTQRDRYLARTVNVIDYDNALAGLQKFNKMLADRKNQQVSYISRRDLSGLPDGPEGYSQLLQLSQRHLELRHSLAKLSQWDVKTTFGRRASLSQNEDPYSSTFASVEFTLNLGAPATALISTPAISLTVDHVANEAAALGQELEIINDRLQVVQEALNRVGDNTETNDKTMEIFARWLELKIESVGIQAQLVSLGRGESICPTGSHSTSARVGSLNNGYVSVTDPTYREAIESENADQATVSFRISGITDSIHALGSGEVREQLGLMLRYINQCNLVYVMVRIADKKIVVQEKVNRGMSTHAECQNQGYETIQPSLSISLPDIKPQQNYQLSAAIENDQMTVRLDKEIVWRGPPPKSISSGQRVGFRSDNLTVEYRLASNQDKP